MIDSHCHLDQEPLISDLKNVISRSKKVGIEKVLTICTNNDCFKNIVSLVKSDPIIFGTFGIHPHETKNNQITKEEIIKNIKSNEKIIGVGETGLDFYYNNSEKDVQIKSFQLHIDAAKDLDIPLIIHSRNAENETLDILKKNYSNKLKILMHCFTGSEQFANDLSKMNSFFSASGIITFKNALALQKTFQTISLNKLLVETDSPYLSPEPKREKKNEPSFVKYTLKKLSDLRRVSYDDLEKITTTNFNKLFFNEH